MSPFTVWTFQCPQPCLSQAATSGQIFQWVERQSSRPLPSLMSPWLKPKLAAIRTSASGFWDRQPAFLQIPFPWPGKLWVSLPAAPREVSGFPPRPRPSPRGGTCSLLSAGSPPRGQSPQSAAACSGASAWLGPWHTCSPPAVSLFGLPRVSLRGLSRPVTTSLPGPLSPQPWRLPRNQGSTGLLLGPWGGLGPGLPSICTEAGSHLCPHGLPSTSEACPLLIRTQSDRTWPTHTNLIFL